MRFGIVMLAATAFSLSGCATTGGNFGINWGNEADHPEMVGVESKGPPPHAPAHGYRAKHRYWYYPSCSVYFEPENNLYFYLKGENWQVSASLPSSLQVQLGSYVSMDLDTDRPYVYYNEHKSKYPPGQMKERNKKKKK